MHKTKVNKKNQHHPFFIQIICILIDKYHVLNKIFLSLWIKTLAKTCYNAFFIFDQVSSIIDSIMSVPMKRSKLPS